MSGFNIQNYLTKKALYTTLLVIFMFAVLALPSFYRPDTFVGYAALRGMRRTLIVTIISDILGIAAALIFAGVLISS
ncbi:MAG: hypothetical protein IJ740_12435, partial [Ruminococcus sp.]|nr:hypothetical protein [Ruminococcus sp.]